MAARTGRRGSGRAVHAGGRGAQDGALADEPIARLGRALLRQLVSVACRTDEAALQHDHSLFVAKRGLHYGKFQRGAYGERLGWPDLARRLRRLFATPASSDIGLPVIDIPVPIDKWPAGACVLVADDNPVNLMVASEMLAYFGIGSLQVADGAEAVAMAANTRLDLILMDLQMPVLDGLGATRQIRNFERAQDRARVPVVAYTSFSGNRLQISHHGIDDVLEKPCELQAMRQCLLRWCPPHGRLVERAGIYTSFAH